MQEKQLLVHLINVVWKWRKALIGTMLITAIGSSAIMLLKANYYKSSTIFYPASTSIQKPVFTEAERNINYYGDDHDVDRMISIAQSLDTQREIIKELNLRSHYGLGEDDKSTDRLFKKMEKSYRVMKTEYDAIKISFQDEDPTFCAKVANHAREKVDHKTQQIIKTAQSNVLSNAKNSQKVIEETIERLKEKLKRERQKYGVYNTESQSEAFAILENGGKNPKTIQNRIKNYTEGISIVQSLEDQIEFATEKLVEYQSNTIRIQSAMESSISSMHIVQLGQKPVRKAGPIRSLYVLGSLLLIGFIALIVILFLENIDVRSST